jgi:hypothetical protein
VQHCFELNCNYLIVLINFDKALHDQLAGSAVPNMGAVIRTMVRTAHPTHSIYAMQLSKLPGTTEVFDR